MYAPEVAGGRHEETEQELARRGDRSRQVAESDEVRAAGASGTEAQLERDPARRGGGAKRAPDVEPAAVRRALAAGEPATEPRSELAHEIARLLDVARGELPERQREQLADARHPAAPIRSGRPLRGKPLCPPRGARAWRLSSRRCLGFRRGASPRSTFPAGATSRARRHRASTGALGAAPSASFLARGPDGGEQLVEQRVEGRPIGLVLHQAGRQRLAQDFSFHTGCRHGAHRVERFGDRDLHAPGPERLHEDVDALAHPADVSRSDRDERQETGHPGDEGEEDIDGREHDHRFADERARIEPAQHEEKATGLGLEEEERRAEAEVGHDVQEERIALGPVEADPFVSRDSIEDLQTQIQQKELVQTLVH